MFLLQSTPGEYPAWLLRERRPLSFHGHQEPGPDTVYREWFLPQDRWAGRAPIYSHSTLLREFSGTERVEL